MQMGECTRWLDCRPLASRTPNVKFFSSTLTIFPSAITRSPGLGIAEPLLPTASAVRPTTRARFRIVQSPGFGDDDVYGRGKIRGPSSFNHSLPNGLNWGQTFGLESSLLRGPNFFPECASCAFVD